MTEHKIAEVLLVEDDPIDVRVFQRAAEKAGLSVPVEVANSGEAAFEYLQTARSQNGRNGTLVVTDINMPGLTGHELMEDVRKDEQLRSTIIFVLSSSNQPKDVSMAYDNGAAGYIVKDETDNTAMECVELLKAFCSAVRLA